MLHVRWQLQIGFQEAGRPGGRRGGWLAPVARVSTGHCVEGAMVKKPMAG